MRNNIRRSREACDHRVRVCLFFLLSGEHPTLPFSEVKSILEAGGYRYRVLERLVQVLRLETDVGSVRFVASRAAMTKVCAMELFRCNAIVAEVLETMRDASLEDLIEEGESFVVRVRRAGGSAPHIASLELERRLGKLILNRVRGVEVSLKDPQRTFFGILTGDKFVFGLKVAEIPSKPFVERRPSNRPFFHPSAMPAKLARCMVNLARPKREDLVLDPFCGTASILVEAGLMGCHVVGLDVQRHMVKGGLQNLLYYHVEPEGMAVADARHPPIAKVDCIVTDPPYGRSATTLGMNTKEIVVDFLSTVENRLPRRNRICIASPKWVELGRIGRDLGLNHIESHFVYVHRSLTREIAVFERM